MNMLGKWGTFIFVPQALLGVATYFIAVYLDVPNPNSFVYALEVAGVVAVFFAIVAMVYLWEIGVALALSSLSAVFALFLALASAGIFAGVCGFIGFGTAFIAARLVKRSGAPEMILFLTLGSLPMIGALIYLLGLADEERERMMKR